MKNLRMTPKRWFWSIMAAGLLWSLVGWRFDADKTHPGILQKIQGGAAQPLGTILIPASFILTRAQITAHGALAQIAGGGGESADQLRARVHALEDENAQVKSILKEYKDKYDMLTHLQSVLGIAPDHLLPANIVGRETGPGSSLIRLDKGATSGVRIGDPVLAAGDQTCILGKVITAAQVYCEVMLITDPQMKPRVQIIRPAQPAGGSPRMNMDITSPQSDHLLEGLGTGRMHISDVNVQTNPPQKGDLVALNNDPAWPPIVQHMVLGEIDSVAPRFNQPQRYDIQVLPRVAASGQASVMILIHE